MRVTANGIGIEVDEQGAAVDRSLLLIMGLGMQLHAWPQSLVDLLKSHRFRVLRMDNRDAGLSDGCDHAGMPRLGAAALRHALGLPVQAPYTIADMAADALGVLDAMGIEKAHVCGASLGGMVAQHLAAAHPHRVSSLTLMMTTSGARGLPQAALRVRMAMLSRPASRNPDDIADHLARLLHVIGSPAYRPDPAALHARLVAMVQRAWRPKGTVRQLMAVLADGDRRTALLPNITAPTAVVHGVADPLIPVAAGHDLVRRIAGARADFIDGMGHDLPDRLLPRFADTIAANAARAQGA